MDGDLDEEELQSYPRQSAMAVGSEGIWTFVFIDMMVFGLIFFVFITQKIGNYQLYEEAHHHLNVVYGFVNTIILLTSSLFVVRGVQAARAGNGAAVAGNLKAALGLGLLFFISKGVEYYGKIESGIGITTNSFFTFYFFITFLHLLHLLGVMIFMVSFWRGSRGGVGSARYTTGLENVGLFWHFVDLLWVFIYSLLYLM